MLIKTRHDRQHLDKTIGLFSSNLEVASYSLETCNLQLVVLAASDSAAGVLSYLAPATVQENNSISMNPLYETPSTRIRFQVGSCKL